MLEQLPDTLNTIQSEDTLVNLFGLMIKPDTIFTVVTTLFVAVTSYYSNVFYKWKSERNRLKAIEMYIYSIADLLKKPIEQQSEELKSVSSKIIDRKRQDIVLTKMAGLNPEFILGIDKHDTFRIFVQHKPRKLNQQANESYAIIYTALFYILGVKETMADNFEKWASLKEDLITKWDASIFQLNEFFRILHKTTGDVSAINDDLLQRKYINIWKAWSALEDNRNLYVLYNAYVKEIMKLIEESQGDFRVLDLVPALRDAQVAFESIQSINTFHSNQFRHEADSLQKEYNQMMEALEWFKQQ